MLFCQLLYTTGLNKTHLVEAFCPSKRSYQLFALFSVKQNTSNGIFYIAGFVDLWKHCSSCTL